MPKRPVKAMLLFALSVEAAPVEAAPDEDDDGDIDEVPFMSIPPSPAVEEGETLLLADFAASANFSIVLPEALIVV